jgi:competence protein ComEC
MALLAMVIALNMGGALRVHTESGPARVPRVKEHLLNPGYTPLFSLDAPDGLRPAGAVTIARPPWASKGVWSLVQAILLNRREDLSPEWVLAFRSTGAGHLLAISGLHLGILMALLFGLLKAMGFPRGICGLLSTSGLWVYVAAVGAPPSALRAGAMATAGLLVWSVSRRTPRAALLPAALLGILVVSPRLITTVGFQLSASAVMGIALATRSIDRSALRNWRGRLLAFVKVSLGAQAGTAPVQVLTFGTLSMMAPLLNLLVVPLLGLWLPAVVLALLLDMVGVGGQLVGAFVDGLGNTIVWAVLLVDRLPGTLVPAPAWAGVVGVMGLAVWSLGGRWCLFSLICLGLVIWSPELDPGYPRVTFLDVGQGDATVIEGGTPRRVIVVDAGPAFGEWNAGEAVVAPYLRRRGIRRIDLLVATHEDADHVGGISSLARRVRTETVLRGDWTTRGSTVSNGLLSTCSELDIPVITVRAGDRFTLGEGQSVEVLAGSVSRTDQRSGNNDRSVVLRVVLDNLRVLLTGDIEESGEQRLRPFHGRLGSDVLKAAHHGSADATSDWLLTQVAPDLVVISAGARNRFGHPDSLLLARLARAGVELWRTDREGALVLESDNWRPMKDPR